MSAPPYLRALERAFAHLGGPDAAIDVHELQRAMGLRAEYLARRLLSVLDLDGDGVIRKDEFFEGLRKLAAGTAREKLLFAFRLHDGNGDGRLDRVELTRMITLALAEDDVVGDDAQAERLVGLVLAAADTNRDGVLSFEELEAALARHPRVLERMTRDEVRWLAPNEDLLERLAEGREGRRRDRWVEGGFAPIVVVAVFALANVALLAAGMLQKARPGHPMDLVDRVAHAATSPIELDAAIVLFPVLRRILTWVRRTWLGHVLPVDEALGFHRIVGHTLFGLCALHGTAVLVGDVNGTKPLLETLSNERGITGITLLALFAVMWVCAWKIVRRSRHFELFHTTHLLYVPWFVIAAAHAPGILAAAGLALVGLVFELVVRAIRHGRRSGLVALQPLRSGVTRVEVRRPDGFAHHPGDYLFLNVPSIARHEWHPFTISSAPESTAMTVHVRSLGNWSSALRRVAEERQRSGDTSELAARIDGPYGSPTGHVFDSGVAVLVGAGIGVTPFASVLESIVLRANGHHSQRGALHRVHFIWVNRDRYSFEWFAALLSELERIDGAGVLDVDVWMTGGRAGTAALALELGREVSAAAGHRDVFTGLRTKTDVGRPDWAEILRAVQAQHPGEAVHVFFCGPPALGRTVRREALRLRMGFRDEKF